MSMSSPSNMTDNESLANYHLENGCFDDWMHGGSKLCVTAAKTVCAVTLDGKQCQS